MKKSKTWYRKKCVANAKNKALERDNHKCVKCGRSKQQGHAIHGSHVYPEGIYRNMSALPLNIIALCYRCHILWWHKHPIEAGEWYKKTYPDQAKELLEISRLIYKVDWEQEYGKIRL